MTRASVCAVVHHPRQIPMFTSEAEEQAFWTTHEMGPEMFEDAEPDAALLSLLPPVRLARSLLVQRTVETLLPHAGGFRLLHSDPWSHPDSYMEGD